MGRLDETAAETGAPAVVLRPSPDLVWTDSAGPHRVTVAGRMVLGAAPGVDVVLDDPLVSRLHAEIEPKQDGLWIRDLGSRNGTFVQGVRVLAACVPDAGRLRLGGVELVVPGPARRQPVELWPQPRFGPLVGPSLAMRELFAQLARVAGSEATVLVQGESGTGKELVARAIHDASPRARNAFVIVDCAALPENLIEAELFGHARGAFTGAEEARAGAIETAGGGTVFLDEIGELPLAVQPKLLRVLESRQVRRLGETQQRPVDVRFISATNRDLRGMVNEREFREDLYFRLAVLPIVVPPLRDRPEDILALVQHFVPEQTRDLVGPELIRKLLGRRWSGNVRELRNFIERALTFGAAEALAMSAAPESGEGARADGEADRSHLPYREARERAIDDFERGYVARLLARHHYEVAAAAQAAGVDRAYLYRLARRHRL